MNDSSTRRPAGAMTRAMSAQRPRDAQPRVLRVGVLHGTSMLTERIFRAREEVSAGHTERATLAVGAPGFPAHVPLFVVRDGRWHLRFERDHDGRVAQGQDVRGLDAWAASGEAVEGAKGVWTLPLDEASRGKVTVAGVTFLFQFVEAPPEAPRPQVPMALRKSLAREMDWRYNVSLASFLSVALGAMTWIEYGYDPVIDSDAEMLEYVARRVGIAPPEDAPREPEAPAEAAAAASANTRPTQSNSTHGTHAPRPSAAQTVAHAQSGAQQAAQRAEAAAASATRALEASFAAITTPFEGVGSAREQLQNGALLAGTEDDLRGVAGITTQGPAVGRTGMQATANLPNGQRLGRSTTIAQRTDVTTGDLAGPVGPRRPPVLTPAEPTSDTCEGDAGAVARVLRGNLGGIRSCYERAARNNPSLRGRLEMRFTVGESGRVTGASVRGVNPDLDTCVEQALRRMVFPVPACGVAEYEYPVSVAPSE